MEEFDWSEDFCEPFFRDGEDIEIWGHKIVAYNTLYGDGCYPSNIGAEFPVDAGLIGAVPKELWLGSGEPFGCTLVKFDKDFECSSDRSTLSFGHVEIYTGDEGEYE